MSALRRDRTGGFALIESIAVLALAALVLLTLLLAADIITRNSAAAARRANSLETLATGFAALRRDLENARFVRVGDAQAPTLLFEGMPRAVGIVVGADPYDPDTGEELVWIEAKYEGDRGMLRRSSAELTPATTAFSGAFSDPAILTTGPWQYRFTYGDAQGSSLNWVERWTSPDRMPVAIRLEVFNAAGTRAVAPPLVVRVRVEADAACQPGQPGCEDEGAALSEEEMMQESNVPEPQ